MGWMRATFSRIARKVFERRVRAFWIELPFKTHTLTHSPQPKQTAGGCERHCLALHGYVFKRFKQQASLRQQS